MGDRVNGNFVLASTANRKRRIGFRIRWYWDDLDHFVLHRATGEMSRFDFYGQRDTPDKTGGDDRWIGIDMTSDMPVVQPGFLTQGENTRLRTGRVQQRRGTFQPGDFNPTAGFGNYLVGSGVFRDPNGLELLIVAPANTRYTWAVAHGRDPFKINYAAAVTGSNGAGGGLNGVTFVQSFDKITLLRRPLQGPQNLVWDGSGPVSGVSTTEWLITTLPADGNTLVPGQFNGEPFQDRLIFYLANVPAVGGRDQWLMTDIQRPSSYDPVFQAFRTNTAEADFITRIISYFRGSVVIFKNQSIHLAELQPTYPVSITQRILNRTLGGFMPVMVGSDILFASAPNGFYSLSEIIQEQIGTLPVPISEEIQDVIDQINWGITLQMGISQAVDNYTFFAVALGRGATRLNAILAYDTQTKKWVSAPDKWTDQTFAFNTMHLTNFDGAQRLFAVDYTNANIYLLYEGINDELASGTWTVPFKMQTRGYTGDNPLGFKRFGRALLGVSTYDPLITVTAITDGFNEEKNLTPTPITKDRTRFYQHGHKDFDVVTDDPTEQKRMDYSIVNPDNFVGDDFEDLAVGPIKFIPGTSPPVKGDQQESLEPFLVRSFGRWCALRVENNNGSCEITSAGVESTPAMNTGRTAA